MPTHANKMDKTGGTPCVVHLLVGPSVLNNLYVSYSPDMRSIMEFLPCVKKITKRLPDLEVMDSCRSPSVPMAPGDIPSLQLPGIPMDSQKHFF